MAGRDLDFKYELLAQDGAARRGRIHTAHGTVETPVFMPVGTQGTVKSMKPEDVKALGAEIILGNTYHLYLKPGHKLIEGLGGLHKFANWPGPILTDSGGFQAYSLAHRREMTEAGLTFASHHNGSRHFIGPEESTQIQHSLDATISMVLDECTGHLEDRHHAKRSMAVSMRWAERSRGAFKPRSGYGQYGIVQGSSFVDLRVESAKRLMAIEFEGYAIGSMMLGEPLEVFEDVVGRCCEILPSDQPRYVMGIGYPSDLIRAVLLGADMFDCVLPTRNARNGQLFTSFGVLNLMREEYKNDDSPIDPECSCYACQSYSRGYIRHLLDAGEGLGATLATTHNLHFYIKLMERLRQAIEEGNLKAVATELLARVR